MSWSGDWPGAVSSSTTSGAREARIWSSSSRSCRITGRACRSSTTPTRWCCRGLPTCGGAPTRWFWNRRAPAPCSRYAIRRSRLPWLRCPRRNRSNSSAGKRILSGTSFSPCSSTAKSFSDRRRQRRPAAGRRRRRSRAVGFSRSAVPRAQHRGPARQSAGRCLSLCGRHRSAAGRAPVLAWKEDRSARSLTRARGSAVASREASARTSFNTRF